METHSAPSLPHRNTTSLSLVAFERSAEADSGSAGNSGQLSAREQGSSGRTEGVGNNIEGFEGTGTSLHQRCCQ